VVAVRSGGVPAFGEAALTAGALTAGAVALTAGRDAPAAVRRSMRAARALRGPTDACVALRRWCLAEWRQPPNIAPKDPATTPSSGAGPNRSRASALEGTASDKATAARMGIVRGRMTVLRPIAASHSTAEFWKSSPLRHRRWERPAFGPHVGTAATLDLSWRCPHAPPCDDS